MAEPILCKPCPVAVAGRRCIGLSVSRDIRTAAYVCAGLLA